MKLVTKWCKGCGKIMRDVRPVVHAQWEDGPEIKAFKEEKIPTVQCPKCLLYFGDLINNQREVYRFCPYCGAQMDGGASQ